MVDEPSEMDAKTNVRFVATFTDLSDTHPPQEPVCLDYEFQIKADVTTSAWYLNDQRYFNLMFTNVSSSAKATQTNSWQSQTDHTGPPSAATATSTPRPSEDLTDQDKLIRMQSNMLNGLEVPIIALWKDESVVAMNKAMGRWTYHSGHDVSITDVIGVISRFKIYSEDFTRELAMEEYPLVQICRSRAPSPKFRVGLIGENARRGIFEFTVDSIYDDETGEFQGVLAALKDVTWYTDQLKAQSDQNERQFQLICETLPQMVSSPYSK